jgi:hypothetical protein
MTLNSSGVRDIVRVLKISKDTSLFRIKKTTKSNPYFPTDSAEMDEFWSFVQNKGNQR